MNDGAQVGIVVVKNVGADAVDHGGIQDVEAFAPPQNAGLGWSGKWSQGGHRIVDSRVMRGADGDAHEIQQRPDSLLAHRGRQVVVFRIHHIARQDPGDSLGGEGLWALPPALPLWGDANKGVELPAAAKEATVAARKKERRSRSNISRTPAKEWL